jgi:hypothetical protein
MPLRMSPESLAQLSQQLETAAADLRAGGLDPERAAELVEQCARLATQAGAELDRRTRAADELTLDGAEQLPLAE